LLLKQLSLNCVSISYWIFVDFNIDAFGFGGAVCVLSDGFVKEIGANGGRESILKIDKSLI
jgi:hypothetical protein